MKFEKINEDKIKVILNISDLSTQNIDFHSFMSNPLNSQDFFSTILDTAEKETGFNTKDYNIKIEILSLSNIDFIITLTRLPIKNTSSKHTTTKTQFLDNLNNINIRQLKIGKRQQPFPSTVVVYCFDNFNDFYQFSFLISSMQFSKNIAKKLVLYSYNEKYYLLIDTLNINECENYKIYSIITDFATYVHNSDIFSKKLSEYGKVIIKNNALNFATKY